MALRHEMFPKMGGRTRPRHPLTGQRNSPGLDRLLVDIDLNYVGALDLAAMERERPEVDAAIDRLFASHGYGVRRRPARHAGGKWLARYASALGSNASLELDLN